MAQYVRSDRPRRLCTLSPWILALCWISGLLAGILLFLNSGLSFSAPMHSFPVKAMSITSLIVVTAFPFLLSISAILLMMPLFLWILCFGKAFLYSFSSLYLLAATGFSTAFSVLLLSHGVSVVLLYLLWLRFFRGSQRILWEAVFLLAVCIFMGSVEYCVISPFLVSLIYY